MSDIVNWLTATHREVGSRRIAAGEARTALMRRRYEAPIEDVWDAVTDPDRISRLRSWVRQRKAQKAGL